MTTQLPAGDVLSMPVVLAGGAAVVLATAAVLTNRSATRPELPAQRWYRPLPPTLAAATDRIGVRVALRGSGLLVAAALSVAAATADTPVNGRVVLAAVVAAGMLAGPLPRIANPVRLALGREPAHDEACGDAVGWPAVMELAVLSALVLTVSDGRVLAVALAGHLVVQAALTRRRGGRWPARGDALEAVSTVAGFVAPIGRAGDGRLAWRNPVVNAAHVTPGRPAVWLTAVLAGLALTSATADGAAATPTWMLLQLTVVTLVAAAVVRAGVIRPFFLGAVGPIAAAYGLLVGGRWLPPVDLLLFVALHAVAIAVLHRQAIARHDPRAARALQFLPRAMVVVSVLTGLAVFAST